jgi:hypothetical protein
LKILRISPSRVKFTHFRYEEFYFAKLKVKILYFKAEKPKRKVTALSRISESSALQDFGSSPPDTTLTSTTDTKENNTEMLTYTPVNEKPMLRSIIRNSPQAAVLSGQAAFNSKQSPLTRKTSFDLSQSLALSGASSSNDDEPEPLSMSTAGGFPGKTQSNQKQTLQSTLSLPMGSSNKQSETDCNKPSNQQSIFSEVVKSLSASAGISGVNSVQTQPLVSQTPTQLDPSQVFLQLFQSKSSLSEQKEPPLLIPDNANIKRSLDLLDIMPCYLVHKIGVIYLGRNQQTSDEKSILSNSYGSVRYKSFIGGLGNLIKLKDMDTRKFYNGGLEVDGSLADFTFLWFDGIVQVQFHVATMMFSKDENLMNKKRHIGNDSVIIVYNESGEEYQFNMLKVRLI